MHNIQGTAVQWCGTFCTIDQVEQTRPCGNSIPRLSGAPVAPTHTHLSVPSRRYHWGRVPRRGALGRQARGGVGAPCCRRRCRGRCSRHAMHDKRQQLRQCSRAQWWCQAIEGVPTRWTAARGGGLLRAWAPAGARLRHLQWRCRRAAVYLRGAVLITAFLFVALWGRGCRLDGLALVGCAGGSGSRGGGDYGPGCTHGVHWSVYLLLLMMVDWQALKREQRKQQHKLHVLVQRTHPTLCVFK